MEHDEVEVSRLTEIAYRNFPPSESLYRTGLKAYAEYQATPLLDRIVALEEALLSQRMIATAYKCYGRAFDAALAVNGGSFEDFVMLKYSQACLPPHPLLAGKEGLTCKICGGEMNPGIALKNKPVMGVPDFPGEPVDTRGQTFSLEADGETESVMKCSDCGRSIK